MKLPLSWLREYVDIDLPVAELAARITDAIAEVEGWEALGGGWDPQKIRVGQVLKVEPHPNADRLRLATVDAGDGTHTVVCGAPNLAVGQKVAFATEGAQLIDGHTGKPAVLKRNTIRGVESAGMVLSERELGLSDSHEGIIELPADAPVGRPLTEQLGDVVLDVSTWANRADLLGVYGFAREVAAMLGSRLREFDSSHGSSGRDTAQAIDVSIGDPDLCRRFTAALIEDVTVGPSPAWLQERLQRAGMRPINNVVDITNYVMLEIGQPIHAFDYDLVRGKQIIARRARPGETLVTLDDVERELDGEMLVICDAEGPVGIAGIMGGGNSEVSDRTKNILLEIANFHPGSIRRTSTLLHLRSEASQRFEKGIGRELPLVTQHRALHLFERLTGGRVTSNIVDVFPGKEAPHTIVFGDARIRQVLGIDIGTPDVRRILTDLGYVVQHLPPDRYSVQVPYWRPDVLIADDVIEDLIRIHGYEALPDTLIDGALPPVERDPVSDLRERLRDAAVAAGGQEVINYTLTDKAMLARVVDPADSLRNDPLGVVNPVANRHQYLRTSLRASVLGSYAGNQRLHDGALRLFEVGFEYLPVEADLPHERPVLCAVLGGRRESRWRRSEGSPLDFYDARGFADAVAGAAGLTLSAQAADVYGFLRGHTAELLAGNDVVGVVGQVHPQTASAFDIAEPVFLVELWVEVLARHVRERPEYAPPERYPDVRIDLSLLLDETTPAGDLLRILRSHRAGSVRIEADIFDEYRGTGLPAGKKALAVALRLWPSDRTLSEQDAARIQDGLLKRLEKEVGATLRA